jgi:hypothetical protein
LARVCHLAEGEIEKEGGAGSKWLRMVRSEAAERTHGGGRLAIRGGQEGGGAGDASRLTGGVGRQRGPVSAAGCGRERGKRGSAAVGR